MAEAGRRNVVGTYSPPSAQQGDKFRPWLANGDRWQMYGDRRRRPFSDRCIPFGVIRSLEAVEIRTFPRSKLWIEHRKPRDDARRTMLQSPS